ncbi:hypothetical protein A6046_02845 [[Haemophilus] ducreyi]|uniref:DsDNA-mimic protein n=1 Tax=Haemophilus ducreyi (strain 35000HP / ATCC 700724) TaxID=233412 RepID=Q7VKI6_HAEDU|nr:hypothetical protein HD_1918 [[Haemophilus] ducreyi 35000HP]AKO37277.1 hypothetical protein RZ61_07580 [[Haemophilus] ducreyi]AKO38742.1 hypothetical protein RZ62_07690 [[Haemophilus] ducreyi]AKO40279.1 hypothetical protein RZ63_07610 [[Haemophilus] ducreyi]AKO41765.1 hypothetical protein RZ64_07545 [[Haemophilus] ducreyi]
MNCEHASELISLNCEQKLKVKDSLQLQIHLWLCPKCRHFKKNNNEMRKLLQNYCDPKSNCEKET